MDAQLPASPVAPRAPDLASYPPLSPRLRSQEAEREPPASTLRSRGLGARQRQAAEEKFACPSSGRGGRGLDLLGQAPPGGSSRAGKGVSESGWTPHDVRVWRTEDDGSAFGGQPSGVRHKSGLNQFKGLAARHPRPTLSPTQVPGQPSSQLACFRRP